MIGPEIDFTRNSHPSRVVIFTDWEARLVEHCLSLYADAAIAIQDSTTPLALKALRKVRRKGQAATPAERNAARLERAVELRMMSPEYGERLDLVEKKWTDVGVQLAEVIERLDPSALDQIEFGRHDGGGTLTATEWLARRRAKAAERATA